MAAAKNSETNPRAPLKRPTTELLHPQTSADHLREIDGKPHRSTLPPAVRGAAQPQPRHSSGKFRSTRP